MKTINVSPVRKMPSVQDVRFIIVQLRAIHLFCPPENGNISPSQRATNRGPNRGTDILLIIFI